MKYTIDINEFSLRVVQTQEAMQNAGIDILMAFGNEAEPQYVRYYADYWPSFESSCVLIPLKGSPVLLTGPEAETLAAYSSQIKRIERIKALRESSEPEYPGEKLNTLYNLFGEFLDEDSSRRVGIVGYPIMNAPVYKAICEAAAAYGCEVLRCDELVIRQKRIKTPGEIAIMRRAAAISQDAVLRTLQDLHPGMSETCVVGIAEKEIRALGAESEAYPMRVLSGERTQHAIGRPDPNRIIQPGQLVQLQFGARLAGYASSVGRPVMMGKVPDEVKDLVSIGLEAHLLTLEWLKPGIPAKEIDRKYREFLQKHGAQGCNLYGPCHGTGLMEGEHPWIEANSDYILEPGLTYMVDTFLQRNGYGLRWEDGAVITETGVEAFTDQRLELSVIDC